jgi:hypothetical protein
MKTILPQQTSLVSNERQTRCLFLTAAFALMALTTLADTKLVSDGAPVRILVPTNGNLGGTWRNLSFDDSSWMRGTNGVGYEVVPGAFSARVIADSQGDWSSTGLQGQNSWINGYYDNANDPDSTYQASDFQPFPRSEGPWSATNFWDGSAWEWFNGDPPWDSIGITAVHPNGINQPQGIHWVIRRWYSTTSGAVTIRFHLRKTNPSGTGVTGKILKNGTEIFTRAIAGGDSTGFEVYVNTTAALGDVFDFAQTPVGPSGDPADGADGSAMTATVYSGTIVPPPPPQQPTAVADSAQDWSPTGVQGANGWFYGFYDKTADADGTYNPNTDFNTTDPQWTFGGGIWSLGPDDPPWDIIGQTEWHPNGDNQPQGIHWVIRRWVSDVDGDLHARVRFGKQNVNGGNGTTLHVLHNGVEKFSQTVAFNDSVGIDTFVPLPGVLMGDKIEFALDPKGTDGLFADGADGSFLTASIFTGPPPQMTVANSVADWGTGAQGANGWYYGYYNETADADHTYNPNSDFNNTDPNWTLLGGAWQLGVTGDPAANPPWDTIAQTEWHPNGDNQPQGVHWVIKRWVSDVDGDLYAQVQFGKQNINGGNGTTLRILHNGTQVFSRTIAFNDSTGISNNVALLGVLIGDKIEFALDPLGTDGTKNDGADGSYLRVSILTGLPPEPPRPFVPGVADCFTTDIETAMKGVNPSVFIRIPFNVADPSTIQTLKLKMKYNDGFAAYLNGKEIVKRNAPTSIAGSTVADSIADWSTNPDVTVNGWSYGYYDQSLDANGTYDGGTDFTPFPHDGGGFSPTDFWVGNGYDWFNGNPPWTELYQEDTHPAAPNGAVFDPANPATHIHWTIRRWHATVDANLKARIRFRKTNIGGGDGVRVSLFHNGSRLYSQAIAGTDGVGRDDTIDVSDVFIGDTIDILLGPGDNADDGRDGSRFSLVLFEGEPTIPWDGAATATRTTTESISPSIFDVSSFISELTPGANLLAIQGFNAGISDNEFLINAELLANRVPVAANDTVTATINTPITYPGSLLLANDSDPDGDRLLLVGVTPSYTTAQGGSVRLFGSDVSYIPPAGYTGNDSFSYTITDLSGTPVRASVSVTVGQTNRCPTNAPLAIVVNANSSLNFQLPAGDPDGNALQYVVTQPPTRGVLVVQAQTGAASYSPAPGACGLDSFRFKVSDSQCESAEATVSITITNCNQCPTADSQTLSVQQDSSVNFQLHASDPDGDPLEFIVTQPPAHGTVTVQALTGAGTYTPASGYCGPDTFKFRASDDRCDSSEATVSITVRCLNQPPAGCAATIVPPECTLTNAEGTLLVVSVNGADACVALQGSATDPDGQPLQYSWWTNGTAFAMGAAVTNCFDVGCHTITFRASDPSGSSCTTNLSFCVIAPSEAVEQCVTLVEQSQIDRKNKRPLTASLKAAAASFDQGNFEAGLNQLHAFQNKVRAQVAPNNPAAAQALTDCAQEIMEAVACSALMTSE